VTVTYPSVVNPRPGQVNAAGNTDSLLLKIFGGEVATAYKNALAVYSKVRKFALSGAKSISLPLVGSAIARFHVPGTNILDDANGMVSNIPNNERVIHADRVLIGATVVNEWDRLINHWDQRMIYAGEIGTQMADIQEIIGMRLIALGAAASAPVSGGSNAKWQGGVSITGTATVHTSASDALDAIRQVKVAFDQRSVPQDQRWLILTPNIYSLIMAAKDLLNTDYNPQGNGSLAQGEVGMIYGFRIIVSNLLPSDDTTGVASAANYTNNTEGGSGNTYGVDMTKVKMLAFGPKALAGVQAAGLRMEVNWKDDLHAWFVKASTLTGMNYWRPDNCAKIVIP